MISYRTQVISGRDVEEIIFCSVTVGRGRFLSRWDNRNLQRRFLLLIKELQRRISHSAPAAGGGRSCTLFWCSRCLVFFLICDLPGKKKKAEKEQFFFNFPDRSLLHRTRHINNCKVNEMWMGCILMMFFGLFWLCKRNFSVLISRTAQETDGSSLWGSHKIHLANDEWGSANSWCRCLCWSTDLPSEIINVELYSLPLFDIIKITLFCGLFAPRHAGVNSGFPLPRCGATRCMNWKWLVHFEWEVAFMWIFPEFKTWKKSVYPLMGAAIQRNATTFSNFRSMYVDPLRVEIKSDSRGWGGWGE